MKAPRRKRPLRRVVIKDVSHYSLNALSEQVKYIGSPEHKDIPSFAGCPRPRADASICDRKLARDRKKVQKWLQRAMADGCIGELWEGRFPRYIWHKEGSIVYEGRLVNRGNGEYKGYPLSDDEWPEGLEK